MSAIPCEFCGHSVPLEWENCPHCARPGLYPNVRMAEQAEERAAVEKRYQKAIRAAEAEGCKEIVGQLEQMTAVSKAVIARKVADVEQLAREDSVYPTYYLKQKLCVAKLASSLIPEMTDSDLAGLMLHQGPSNEEDRFVEVHIWGSISARTLERVILRREAKPRTLTEEIRLRDKLAVFDIPLEVVTL